MAKDPSVFAATIHPMEAADEHRRTVARPRRGRARVRGMQSKLHQWAVADPDRRFGDLYNLVYDPAFLAVAWSRVQTNKGARTGVDGIAPDSIGNGAGEFIGGLQQELKSRRYAPTRVREKAIPKTAGKIRRLGIPTAADRVVQASLKLVMEPIFEAEFKPCSYGFRPNRRAQDAIAEIHYLANPTRRYEWVFEADITACFDEIKHSALMDRVRGRIKDKRILRLVRAFLRAGILRGRGGPANHHRYSARRQSLATARQYRLVDTG